jgi:hypothetical protein
MKTVEIDTHEEVGGKRVFLGKAIVTLLEDAKDLAQAVDEADAEEVEALISEINSSRKIKARAKVKAAARSKETMEERMMKWIKRNPEAAKKAMAEAAIS